MQAAAHGLRARVYFVTVHITRGCVEPGNEADHLTETAGVC